MPTWHQAKPWGEVVPLEHVPGGVLDRANSATGGPERLELDGIVNRAAWYRLIIQRQNGIQRLCHIRKANSLGYDLPTLSGGDHPLGFFTGI